MFKIKICGITNAEDGRLAAMAGADAIGLNFYKPSPRFVELSVAEEIVQELPDHVKTVGVFVDLSADEICQIYDRLQLDYVQLHGDQPVEFVAALGNRPFIRAFRCKNYDLQPVRKYWDECQRLESPLESILLDSYQTGLYGGTGKAVDWDRIERDNGLLEGVNIILSGGLVPLNVAGAISTVCPLAVDTASGVESSPGVKDFELMRAFVEAARAAMDKNG